MRIWIAGIAGVLGSALARLFLEMGFEVAGNDIVRREEAWRLEGIIDEVRYVWKSSWDLDQEDLRGFDIVVDCSIEFPDRPMGISSPTHVAVANLMPALRILEIARRLSPKPVLIYPSSFNALYGHPPGTVFRESTPPKPSSLYGWTKAAAELLYQTYRISYGVPVVITRVGSAYGPRMRSDELVARLIIYALRNRRFVLRSPLAKRLWTYQGDVLEFYRRLIERIDEVVGMTLICAGNKGDRIVTNMELAQLIKRLTGSSFEIVPGDYEPGEIVGGEPITFYVDASFTRELLGWRPMYSLEDGLRETIAWFRENLWRYL